MVAALPGRARGPGGPRTLLLALGVVLALGAVAMVAARQWAAAGGLGVAAVAIIAVGIWGYATRGTGSPEVSGEPSAGDRLEEAEASLGRQKTQLQELDAQVAAAATELGVAGSPSALDVEGLLGRIGRKRAARARADELSRQLDAVLADTRERQGQLVRLEAELQGGSSELRCAHRRVGPLADGKGCPRAVGARARDRPLHLWNANGHYLTLPPLLVGSLVTTGLSCLFGAAADDRSVVRASVWLVVVEGKA